MVVGFFLLLFFFFFFFFSVCFFVVVFSTLDLKSKKKEEEKKEKKVLVSLVYVIEKYHVGKSPIDNRETNSTYSLFSLFMCTTTGWSSLGVSVSK